MSSSPWSSPGVSAAPFLCLVHDDVQLLELLARDIQERFGSHYEIESLADADSALRALERHAADDRRVAALFSADNAVCGADNFRARVRDLHRDARRVVLVGRQRAQKAVDTGSPLVIAF